MTKRTRNFWIEVVSLVLIVGSIAVGIAASEFKTLNNNDVKLVVSDLRSFAASGRQLIAQHEAGQLTENFCSTQVELLEEKVSSSHQTLLGSQAEPEATENQREASDLAAGIDAAISALQSPALTEASVEPRLRALEATAQQLEERLKHE